MCIHRAVPFIKVGEREEGFQSRHSDLGERGVPGTGCEDAFGESWWWSGSYAGASYSV